MSDPKPTEQSRCIFVCDTCHGEGEGCHCDCHDRSASVQPLPLGHASPRALTEFAAVREEARCHHGWRGQPPKDGERILTPCPECGAKALFIGDGGHLTCARVPYRQSDGCPSPSVEVTVDKLKARVRELEAEVERLKNPTEYESMLNSIWRNKAEKAEAEVEALRAKLAQAEAQIRGFEEADRIWTEEFEKGDDPHAATVRVLRAKLTQAEADLAALKKVAIAQGQEHSALCERHEKLVEVVREVREEDCINRGLNSVQNLDVLLAGEPPVEAT